jgi:hypothetical protein
MLKINLIDHTAMDEDDTSPYTITIDSELITNWDIDKSIIVDNNLSIPDWTVTMQHDYTGKINITGEDADVVLNGLSLKDALTGIQERLAILQPNPELEKEFVKLRELREEYQKLEKTLLEKKAMWDALGRDD